MEQEGTINSHTGGQFSAHTNQQDAHANEQTEHAKMRKQESKKYGAIATHLRKRKDWMSTIGKQSMATKWTWPISGWPEECKGDEWTYKEWENDETQNTMPLVLTSGMPRNRRVSSAATWEAKSTPLLISKTHTQMRRLKEKIWERTVPKNWWSCALTSAMDWSKRAAPGGQINTGTEWQDKCVNVMITWEKVRKNYAKK